MSAVATQEPQADVTEVVRPGQPKAEPEPRYAPDMDDLSAKVLAAREAVGRKALADFAGQSQSCIWRWERSRVHPGAEADAIRALVRRIDAGELPTPEPKPRADSKAELTHRIEVAVDLLGKSRGDRKVSKIDLVDAVLAVLMPADAPLAS
jgi:hypothetical protein